LLSLADEVTEYENLLQVRMSPFVTSRHFAAAQQFGRFRSEADIEPLTEPDF
jgi:hypothetical protein